MEPPGVPPPIQYGQPYNPPGTPPPVQYGYQQQQQYMAQQGPTKSGVSIRPVALLGAVIAAVATFLPWVGEGNKILAFGGQTRNSYHDIPLSFLWDFKKFGAGGFRLGFVVIALVVLAAALSLVGSLSLLRRLVGLLLVAVAVVYGLELFHVAARVHSQIPAGTFHFYFRILGYGSVLSAFGGLLIAAG